jgi:glyoxylase-like metal-dependent hydrolase (beta-lactamase superfamily II)
MSQSRSAWTEPGTQDLGGGVYRIPLPLPSDGLRAVNVYALRTGDGLVMIDGGWALEESERQLSSSLAGLGYELADISSFLVTHIHRDHFTQAVAVRRKFGSEISLGAAEQPNLDATLSWIRDGRNDSQLARLHRAGAGPVLAQLRGAWATDGGSATALDWEPPDTWLTDRRRLVVGNRELEVIATPGHTQGHVVFHDAAAKLLFAGDHVLPQITPSIGFEPAPVPFPLRNYLDSLRLMFQLPDAMLLPAHGPVTESVHQRVTELLAHHDDRLAASAAAVSAGAPTAYQVALALPWTRRRRAFDELDPQNQFLAVSETAAHLDVLVLQHRLTSSTGPDGVEYYQP